MPRQVAQGLVVGKFAPLHRGHQFLIETALAECRRVVVMVYARPDFVRMPQALRASWVRTLHPAATVLAPDDPPLDSAGDEAQRDYVRGFLEARGLAVDAVFTSEDYGQGLARHLGAQHRLVDRARRAVPISGSAVRADPTGNRRFLDPRDWMDLANDLPRLDDRADGPRPARRQGPGARRLTPS